MDNIIKIKTQQNDRLSISYKDINEKFVFIKCFLKVEKKYNSGYSFYDFDTGYVVNKIFYKCPLRFKNFILYYARTYEMRFSRISHSRACELASSDRVKSVVFRLDYIDKQEQIRPFNLVYKLKGNNSELSFINESSVLTIINYYNYLLNLGFSINQINKSKFNYESRLEEIRKGTNNYYVATTPIIFYLEKVRIKFFASGYNNAAGKDSKFWTELTIKHCFNNYYFLLCLIKIYSEYTDFKILDQTMYFKIGEHTAYSPVIKREYTDEKEEKYIKQEFLSKISKVYSFKEETIFNCLTEKVQNDIVNETKSNKNYIWLG